MCILARPSLDGRPTSGGVFSEGVVAFETHYVAAKIMLYYQTINALTLLLVECQTPRGVFLLSNAVNR